MMTTEYPSHRSKAFAMCFASFLLPVLGSSVQGTEPAKKTADTSVQRIEEIYRFFNMPQNRNKMLLPIPETGYAWQNMSRFYPTAMVQREGPVSQLPVRLDPAIGKVTFQKGDKTEMVEEHLTNYPVDAFLVVSGGTIVFAR